MSRIRHFDIAKGIGIVLVVIGHSAIELGRYLIYMFHMPLFFFLSGIFWRPKPFGEMIWKKAHGLLLPFVIFSAFLLILGVGLFRLPGNLSLTFPHCHGIVGPLWFLLSLFEVSVVFHAIASLCSPGTTMIICLALTFFLGYLPDILGLENWLYVFTSFSVLVFYALGAVFGKKIKFENTKWLWVITLTSAALFSLAYYVGYKVLHLNNSDLYSNVHSHNFMVWLWGSITGIAMVLLLAMILDTSNLASRFLAYLGECSLFIFAFHMSIIKLFHESFQEGSLAMEISIIIIAIAFGCLCRPFFQHLLPSVFGKNEVSKTADNP